MSAWWVYPGPVTTTAVVVMSAMSVGLLAVGVLRGETRFRPEATAARSAVGVLAVSGFAVAGIALLVAIL